jgi:hypothetical protein
MTCDGTREVGHFWSEALGMALGLGSGRRKRDPCAGQQRPVHHLGPPFARKSGKNRLHLDIAPPDHVDQRAEVERLLALGATRIDIGQGEVDWVVMADPDDNEFCLLSPH